MTGALLGAVTALLLAGTGVLLSATLRIRGFAAFILGVYVIAFAAADALFLFLSVFDAVSRAALVVGSVAICAAAGAVWTLAGTPRPPSWPNFSPRRLVGHGPVTVLAIVVALALAYVVALIVGTAPNGWDPLNYHLARAAFWLQSGGVGYIEPVYDERLNLNPPDAEMGTAFALGVTHDEVVVGFVQFAAALACAVGVVVLARRVGLRRNEAVLGGLLFLTLPIVLLQSAGAKNDLVLASFLVAAAVFVLGRSRAEIGLASLATALAVGTKSTATYGVAVLLVLALVALPRTQRAMRVVAIAVGAIVGAYWYLVNAVDSGRLLGDQSAQQHVTAPFHPAENLLTAYGTAIDTLDVSGARGKDILLYAVAALLVGAALVLTRRRRGSWAGALVAAAMLAAPLVLFVLSDDVLRTSFVHLYDALGKPYGYLAIGDEVTSSPSDASDTASWFGALGFLLVVATPVLAYRRRSLRGVPAVLALAPFGWFVLVALTLTYNPWLGRFFVFPVALSAALWGRVLGTSASRWGAATLACVTAMLALVHFAEKPSGLRLLDRARTESVWKMDRWQVQSLHDPAVGPVFRFLDDDVPRATTIALALEDNGFGYPVFGPHLQRHVEIVPFGSTGDVPAQWLYADANRAREIDSSCWRAAFNSDAGSVFERTGTCRG